MSSDDLVNNDAPIEDLSTRHAADRVNFFALWDERFGESFCAAVLKEIRVIIVEYCRRSLTESN